MKKLATLASATALALSLGGCAQFDQVVNNATAWLASPQTQQAVTNLKSGVTALVCAISVTSQVAAEVETGVGAGKSMIGTDGKVYVASTSVCAALGGTVAGSAVVP